MTKEQFEDVTKWQRETFSQATPLSKLAHLEKEILEVQEHLELPGLHEGKLEFADCFLLLFGAASAYGMSYEDIVAAIDEKMKINKARKWGEPDEKGIVNHI